MEPRRVQPRLQSVEILPSHQSAFFSTVLPTASSLSISGGFQSSYGTATLPTHAPLVAAARTPPAAAAIRPLSSSSPPPPPSSSQLLREIKKTGELLRTFRSLKERGASRAELADFHARVKALKAGQRRRERLDVGAQSDSTPPAATSTAHLERQAPATTVGLVSLCGQRVLSLPTRDHGDSLYCDGSPMGSSGSSGARGLHPQHSRDVCLDPQVLPSTTVCLSTLPAQPYTPIPNGRGEKASSGGNAGARSAATLHPSAAASMGGSLVSLNSIVFAVVLAEAHMRREIMHRWERRWLRHWANFKEGRVAIALRPPTSWATAAADFSHRAPPVRWAESASISLPCGHLQREHAALAPIEEIQGAGSAATNTGPHAIRVNPQPVLGWSIENERPTSTKRVVSESFERTPPVSLGFYSTEKLSGVAEVQQVTILSPGNTPQQADTHGEARTESPRHQTGRVAQTTEEVCEVDQRVPANPAVTEEAGTHASSALPLPRAGALAAAAEQLAAALRRVENGEGLARKATEGAALEALERVRGGEAAARRRDGEARKIMQSLLHAEADTRVIIEGDEHRLRGAHLAELEDAQRALLLAAATVEMRRMEEERALQEAAAKAAAVRSEEKRKEREAAARRAAERAALESQLLTSAEAESTERRAIEQQWQADLRCSEALLAKWVKDAAAAAAAAAAAPRRRHSTDIPNSTRTPSAATATEDVASMGAIEAQALVTAKQEIVKHGMAALRATIDAVLVEWIHTAATDAVARQQQADQAAAAAAAAVAEAASQRRKEEVAAQAEAMMRERAAVFGAARAAVMRAENEGRAALVCCEEEAFDRLQRECAMSMEELLFAAKEKARRCAQEVAATKDEESRARLEVEAERTKELARIKEMEKVARSLEEEKAVAERHRLERAVVNAQKTVSALANVFCTAATDLSEGFVDCVLAEAAQQASAQRVAVALAAQKRSSLLEAQSRQRGEVQGDEAAARNYLYGELLHELTRLTREASAIASKPLEAEAVIATDASEHHGLSSSSSPQRRAPATALCLSLLDLSESLMQEFLRDAAAKASMAGAGAVSALGLAKNSPPEAPPKSAFPDKRVTEVDAVTENEQQHPVKGDVKEPSDTGAEERHVGAMGIPEEEGCEAAADALVGTPSLPLSRSSSANAAPGANAGGVSQCHAEELWRLPSATVFVRLADGLLADLLREASQEAPTGDEILGDTIGEARTALEHAAQTIPQCRGPSPDDSATSAVTQDGHFPDSASRGVTTPAHPLSSLTLPSSVPINTAFAATAAGAEGNDGLRVQCAESEEKDAAGGAEGDARVSNTPQGFVDVTSPTTAWTTLGACVGEEGGADASADATAPLRSSPHCLSTTSSGDGDEDAANSPLTLPEAPLPPNLQQHRLLSPLLLQQGVDTSRLGDGCGEATALSGDGDGDAEGAAANTETPAVLVAEVASHEHSIARQGPRRSFLTSDDNTTTPGADESLSDIGTTNGSASRIAEDSRAFRLDRPASLFSSLCSVAELGADATVPPTRISLLDTLATVATSLVERAVYEAALLAAPREPSAELITGSEHVTACDVAQVDPSSSPHTSPSSATSNQSSATEGGKHHSESDSCMRGANSSSRSHEGDVGDELMAAHITERGPDSVSVGARETTTLQTSPSASPAAGAVAAEGVSGSHTPLAGLSILAGAITKPNLLTTELRQQHVDKRAAAHHQDRFLTNREVALVAARYVTSEAAVSHVQQACPTSTLSARVVALVLSVGLVHAVRQENRAARRRVEAAGGESQRPTGGGGGNDGLPTGICSEGRTVQSSHSQDLPPLSYTTGRYGDGGLLDTFGPPTPNAEDNATQTRGAVEALSDTVEPASPLTPQMRNIRGTGMAGDSGAVGPFSPSQNAYPSSEVATESKASDLGEGVSTSNPAHEQRGVCDKLPSDWATALRGVAERVAHDFIDYASRCFLVGHGDGHSNQDHLRTAQRIRDDALARVDLHSLFTRDLRLRDVARLTYYYVELAANGPRDRADPNCSPVSFGERNIFGRRSSRDMDLAVPASEMCSFSTCSREDVPSQDQRYTSPKSVLAPSAHLQPSSSLSPPLHSRNDSLLSAATAVHIRRAGLVQLVLEQCVSNVVNDLVGDTVGWLGTIYQQSAPQPGLR